MSDLSGRSALVTGGARGLGRAIAKSLISRGAAVVIADVRDEEGEQTAKELSADPKICSFMHLDVTDESGWVGVISSTVSALGGFDILVNNAGLEETALVSEFDVAAIRRMVDVNLMGTLLGMKHAFLAMKPGGSAGNGGAVINIASVAARLAVPAVSGYSATKSAVDRMTRVAAVEAGKLGYGIRVNCVYPGLVLTEMGLKLATDLADLGLAPSVEAAKEGFIEQTPQGRLASPSEIADTVCFLCSDEARFINGVGVAVDGGMST